QADYGAAGDRRVSARPRAWREPADRAGAGIPRRLSSGLRSARAGNPLRGRSALALSARAGRPSRDGSVLAMGASASGDGTLLKASGTTRGDGGVASWPIRPVRLDRIMIQPLSPRA